MGLHTADYLVLLLYFIIITIIGIWSARKLRDSNDFFMPRKFGKLMMAMFSFGTGTHSDQAVSVAAKSFTNGLSGIWYQWLWLPVTPFYWLIAPIFRRFRAVTTANVFEARFDGSVSALYAFIGVLNLSVNIGIMLKGAGAVISASTGQLVSSNAAIAVMTILFVIYGVAGGLSAAIITDFIQGILTIIFSFALLPLVMNAVGGFDGIRETVGSSDIFSLVAPSDIGFFYIAVIAVNALVGVVTQPHTMGNCGAGRTELEGRVGFMFGTLLKRLCTIPWALTGVAAVAYFAGTDIHPDKVFGAVAGDFLPKLVPGMLGLFLAALVASVMSSCDVFMVSSSALFTENIYKRFRPNKQPRHYILVARIAAILVVGGGVYFAFWLPSVVEGLETFWKISSMMGIAFWLGLFWRRTTVAGAWAATITAFAIWWLTTQTFFITFLAQVPYAEQLRFVTGQASEMAIYLPWQMIFYLTGGTAAGIIVSVLTRAVPRDKLDIFYALICTPVRAGEKITTPCTIPEGAVVPDRRKLFPKTNIEIPVPSRTSVIGFIIGWICVVVLVGAVYLITQS